MQQEIPHITFKSRHPADHGIEIITLSNLQKRKAQINHDTEKAHQVAFNMLVLYTQGTSSHLVDFVRYPVAANTLIYLSRGQVNAFKYTEGVEGFIILFTDEYLKRQLHNLPESGIIRLFDAQLFSPKIVVKEASNIMAYVQLLYKEFWNGKSLLDKIGICDSLFRILFLKLEALQQFKYGHLEHDDKLVLFLTFKNLLQKNFTESRNAAYYASKLHISYKHLNVVCKTVMNTTAKDFIDAFVILEAKRRLVNSTVKSNELAFQMGFQEPTNFVKYFKNKTGFTPNSFKKAHS